MNELFTVLENGQLEVNWESLELKTSEKFVLEVKKYLNRGTDKEIKAIDENDKFINVSIMNSDVSLREISYDKRDGYILHTEINFLEVRKFIKYGGKF